MAFVVQVQGIRLDPLTPTAILFLPAVPNPLAQQQIVSDNLMKSAAFSAAEFVG